ncbi:MAG: cell division/cell wall cluster transcriptional repressor MraZ [Dehalococcoidia bacterium]|jgi:MraZ protein|nr:cell division/cell wall cluster transcriptional repressor MraZ [Dehalococcoidia bacterium]
MAFRGEFEYSLDNRGRIPIPARYRASFGSRATLVQSQDGCVEVYTVEAYEKEAEFLITQRPVRRKARRRRRRFFGHSFDVDLDGQGRILLSPKLREHGDLQGPVIIVGRGECLEIWNPQRWDAEESEMDEEYESDAESTEEGP